MTVIFIMVGLGCAGLYDIIVYYLVITEVLSEVVIRDDIVVRSSPVQRSVAIGWRRLDRESEYACFISFHLPLSLVEAAANQLRV